MKKVMSVLLALALILSLTACGGTPETPQAEANTPVTTASPAETKSPADIPTAADDDWESQAEAIILSALNTLTAEYEGLVADVDSYSAYIEKKDEITAFYETVNTASANLCIEMCALALSYTESILASDKSADDMYEDMDELHDLIYDDMGDEIYDGIYDGILDDLYDDLYGGALDDRPDNVEYEDWSDARSNEYEQWSDTRSDTYEHWSDFRSDVYDFWSDVRSALWGEDMDDVLEEVGDFREAIEKMSGETTSQILPTDISTTLVGDDWESRAEAEVVSAVNTLMVEHETLIAKVDSYASYVKNRDEITAFYEKIIAASAELGIKMCTLAADYAESILTSGKPVDDMYDDMDDIYDLFYDDMGDEVYDGIYDELMDDVYDSFYGGALGDIPDDLEYAEWSEVHSDEYEQWSDTHSEIYELWSDYRSDVYDFWSDMRSALWSDDLEDAQDVLDDFREDVEKMYGKLALEGDTPAENEKATSEATATAADTNGIDPDFKAAMDSYEEFMDEYVAFMKKYMDNPNDVGLLVDYADYVRKYAEFVEDFEKWENEEMNAAETAYYIEVQGRVSKKLLEVA